MSYASSSQVGSVIRYYRKKAGLTQKAIAESLSISDKAVSKWERGINLPDTSLLKKLADLLDVDIDTILGEKAIESDNEWQGVLDAGRALSLSTQILGKPLVYYLLSTFMLAGIRLIHIRCTDEDVFFIQNKLVELESLGLKIIVSTDYPRDIHCRTMLIRNNAVLFGVGLTTLLKKVMNNGEMPVALSIQGKNKDDRRLPIVFGKWRYGKRYLYQLEENQIGMQPVFRGYIPFCVTTHQDALEFANFVNILENRTRSEYCNIEEIAKNRGFM